MQNSHFILISSGSSLSFITAPLAADLFFAVDELSINDPSGGCAAYAQSYGVFTCAMAVGTTVGPVLAGATKQNFGWTIMTWILAAFSISGAVPAFFFTGRHIADRRSNGTLVEHPEAA